MSTNHRQANASAPEKARLDQVVLDFVSDNAANHHLLLAVRLHWPQNTSGDSEVFYKIEDRRAWRKNIVRAGLVDNGSEERGTLLKAFYEATPPGSRKDAVWIQQDEGLQSLMQAYWTAFCREAKPQIDDPEVMRYLEADLDPTRIAELHAKRQAIRDDIAERASTTPVVPKVVTVLEEKTKLELTVARTKIKTRPVQSIESDSEKGVVVDQSTNCMPLTKVATSLTKHAREVFSRMFATDAEAAAKGSDRDQVVYAMKDAGCTVRNGAGSAVVFEVPDEGKIVFHKPHPEPKVDGFLLRSMGKRLNKWFGWGSKSIGLDDE